MSSLDEVHHLIAQAMRGDQFHFRRQLRTLREAAKQNRPHDRNLTRLATEVQESVDRRAKRAASIPTIPFDDDLPVSQRRDELRQALLEHQVLVVCGETGSGKSTQLPKICLEAGRGIDGVIGHTQPRRIAARSIATRISQELRGSAGLVGSKVRFNDETGPQTLIKLMTDGILLAETQRDRFLNQYDTLIIDEAHERSLNIDFLLGYLKQLLPRRPDLKVIITSATIDAERFAEHFATNRGPAPILTVSGRTYPVEVRWRPPANEDDDEPDWDRAIAQAIDEVSAIDNGDVLVFLPTERDIHDLAKVLRGRDFPGDRAGRKTEILPLYARLPTSEQNRVFAPHPHRRIVLATNVAESSLTVPGIRYVIDPGTARISRYSARSKFQRLPIEPIAQSSADQRKGRCGRVGPGICVRLYSEQDYLSRERFTPPEVQRTSLASVILQLKTLNFGEIEEFPFMDPPRPEAIRDGIKTLFELGALDEANQLTPLGRRLGRLPVDPRVGRIILAGDDEGCLSDILIIAAVLELQDPRERPLDKQQVADECHAQFAVEDSDFLGFLKLWDFFDELRHKLSRSALRKACHQNFLSYNRIQEWLDVHRQLLELCAELGLKPQQRRNDSQAIHRALLTGLLSNVALKGEGQEYQVGGGAKVVLWPGSALRPRPPKWVVAAEQIETTRRYLRVAGKIDPGWIERLAAHLIKRSYGEPTWNPQRACVTAPEKVSLWGLAVMQRASVNFGPIDPVQSRTLFIRHALVRGEYQTPGKFRQRNQKLLDDLKQLEKKIRHAHFTVDEQVLEAFFDTRIPPHVFDGARFEKWRQVAERDQPDLLCFQQSDLLGDDSPQVTAANYPDQLSLQGSPLPLDYRFDPGHAADGVTLTVPMHLLNQIDRRRVDWLIPGLLEERVLGLIKGLPKELRRLLVPANDTAKLVAQAMPFGTGDLCAVLARDLEQIAGQPVDPALLKIDNLPEHLRLNIRVIDSEGKTIAEGRDLIHLQQKLGVQVARSFQQVSQADPRWNRTGITKWDFGELPLETAVLQGGLQVRGFPAVVAEGEGVALRLLDSAERAAAASRQGLRRLFVLANQRELKNQVSHLPVLEQKLPLGTTIQQAGRLKSELIELLADRALYRDEPPGRLPRPTNEAQWRELSAAGTRRIGLATQDLCELMGPLLATRAQAKQAIDRLGVMPTVQYAVRDAKDQLAQLTPDGYLVSTPWTWLQQYPRYLQSLAIRLQKLQAGGLARDQKGYERVQPFVLAYEQRLAALATRGISDPQLEHFRWMLEEFRVSVFTQELRTALPVSEKRLEEQFAKVTR
jgi:ATP-dependent helicase HrpA